MGEVIQLLEAFILLVTVGASSHVAFYAAAFAIWQFAIYKSHQALAVLLTNHGTGTFLTVLVTCLLHISRVPAQKFGNKIADDSSIAVRFRLHEKPLSGFAYGNTGIAWK